MVDKILLGFKEGDTLVFNGREMELASIAIGRTYGRMFLVDGGLHISGDVNELIEIGLDIEASEALKE